jgi:diguanylate cyclase (GGDEF)-like protein
MVFDRLLQPIREHLRSFGVEEKYKSRVLYIINAVFSGSFLFSMIAGAVMKRFDLKLIENLILFFFNVTSFILLFISKKIKFSSILTFVSILLCISVSMTTRSFFDPFSLLIVFGFPFLAVFLRGRVYGVIWSIAAMSLIGIMLLISSQLAIRIDDTWNGFRPYLFGYYIISIIGYIYSNEKVRSKKAILWQFYHNELTNLPNRNQLMADLKSPIKWLILINLDDFKGINDFFSSKTGDVVLQETAKRLVSIQNREKNYQLYHLHGDEFAFVSLNPIGQKETEACAETIYQNITREAFLIKEQEINMNVTLGIASESPNILTNADIAMKLAKKRRKFFLVYNESIKAANQYEENLRWSVKLKEAIRDDRIIPYFQPIVNSRNGKIEKYECLARLIDINGMAIVPAFFLNVAKKTKLYPFITRKMIVKSFEEFKNKPYEFSINISLEDILDRDTVDFILDSLKKFEIGKKVVFEILESEGIENYDEVSDFIKKVKAQGCKVAIDDFGSGYSNFEHIMRLNVDYLKIDGSIIKRIDSEVRHQIIVKNIVEFSRELRIKTISEFVHSEDIHKWVKYLNIDYEQGYYWGEPVSTFK